MMGKISLVVAPSRHFANDAYRGHMTVDEHRKRRFSSASGVDEACPKGETSECRHRPTVESV
ncbi:MAG: hypothetical protein AAGJ56_07660, partial [Myxococcota bacterium]